MNRKIKWGILGTGRIAHVFAEGLAKLDDAEITAAASRTRQKAEDFAQIFNINRAYSSYQQLADDPDIDIIYIATPHSLHMENTIMCLNAGKAVLCEKSFAVNAGQVKKMIQTARAKNLFLAEAMWTRFLPVIVQVRKWLNEKAIGRVKMLMADFGFDCRSNGPDRLLNPNLAGGALLYVGIYPVSFASMVFGRQPEKITSLAHIGDTGVDEISSMIFGYDHGQLAALTCAVKAKTKNEALIIGSKGSISIPNFWSATEAALQIYDAEPRTINLPWQNPKTGLDYQAVAAMDCLRNRKTESDVMPLGESLQIMETMDKIRKQWGLKYPFE